MKNRNALAVGAIFLLIGLAACSPAPESAIEQAPPAVETEADETPPTAMPEPEPTTAAPDKATYELYFDATWSAETHPADYDPDAHFSPFIAYGHTDSPDALIFSEKALASPGIELMAETGETNLLITEILEIIMAGNAADYIQGARIDSPGTNSGLFGFSQERSWVTFVSMIAPSPDWFVAASADLFQDGQWVEELTLELVSYDSGTDSGETLTAPNADTQPPEAITRMPDNLQNMGTLTLIRVQ